MTLDFSLSQVKMTPRHQGGKIILGRAASRRITLGVFVGDRENTVLSRQHPLAFTVGAVQMQRTGRIGNRTARRVLQKHGDHLVDSVRGQFRIDARQPASRLLGIPRRRPATAIAGALASAREVRESRRVRPRQMSSGSP